MTYCGVAVFAVFFAPPQYITFFCTTAICNFFCATTICHTSSNMVAQCYNVKKRDILRCSHFCCCVFCATAICHTFFAPPQFVTFFGATTICHTSSNMCYNVKKHFILQWRKNVIYCSGAKNVTYCGGAKNMLAQMSVLRNVVNL